MAAMSTLALLAAVYITSLLAFVCGFILSRWLLAPVSLLWLACARYLRTRTVVQESRRRAAMGWTFIAPLVVTATSIAIGVCALDVSCDRLMYHKEAIIQLAHGWNPFYEEIWPNARGNHQGIWINNYPRFSWIVGAFGYVISCSVVRDTGRARLELKRLAETSRAKPYVASLDVFRTKRVWFADYGVRFVEDEVAEGVFLILLSRIPDGQRSFFESCYEPGSGARHLRPDLNPDELDRLAGLYAIVHADPGVGRRRLTLFGGRRARMSWGRMGPTHPTCWRPPSTHASSRRPLRSSRAAPVSSDAEELFLCCSAGPTPSSRRIRPLSAGAVLVRHTEAKRNFSASSANSVVDDASTRAMASRHSDLLSHGNAERPQYTMTSSAS